MIWHDKANLIAKWVFGLSSLERIDRAAERARAAVAEMRRLQAGQP